MSDPRLPLAPPPRLPPLSLVAANVLELEEWIHPDTPILEFLRALPEVAGHLRRLEAERAYHRLRDAGIGSVEARRLVGPRFHACERTLRRWGLTD